MDGRLRVESEGPSDQLRPPGGQGHEDDQLVLDVFVYAAATLDCLEELLRGLDSCFVGGELGGSQGRAAENAASRGFGDQDDAAAITLTAVSGLLVGFNVNGDILNIITATCFQIVCCKICMYDFQISFCLCTYFSL